MEQKPTYRQSHTGNSITKFKPVKDEMRVVMECTKIRKVQAHGTHQ